MNQPVKNLSGTLYLIPVPVAEDALHTLPAEVFSATAELEYYFAENARTARRWIKKMHPSKNIEAVQFSEIDKHTGADIALLKKLLKEGKKIGIMSEAGCPAVADPGSLLVKAAHEAGAKVVPLTGPSSIILSLMGSGLDGQQFAFCGYLPVKEPLRSMRIKALEARSAKECETQIFIETPYRNEALLKDLLQHCKNNTRLCIAQNLTAADAYLNTKTISAWKSAMPRLEKVPAVFLLLADF